MEKGDDMVMKGASVLDRAKDEVVAITDTVHGALHSVKKETEEKAERLKGGLKHLLHKAKAPPFYDKAKADIKDHLLFSNHNFIGEGELGEGEGNVATHPAPAETEINAKKQGQTNSSPADHESTSIPIPIPIPIPVQQVTDDGNKERDHNNYFAQFFEKCCQPFTTRN